MMDNGIGMDMVSLSSPPLHTGPLFISKRLKKETVPVASTSIIPPYQHQHQQDGRLEAANAAAMLASKQEQQHHHHQQTIPLLHHHHHIHHGVEVAGSGRRSSATSEEVLIQEPPKYEVSASFRDRKFAGIVFGSGGTQSSTPLPSGFLSVHAHTCCRFRSG